MVKPHVGGMPSGGERVFGGRPTFGSKARRKGSDYVLMIYCRKGHKTRKVARLVCEAFHGPPPPGSPYCLHINENALDNRPENLKWGTQKENLQSPRFLEYASRVCQQKMTGMKLKQTGECGGTEEQV